MAVCLRARTISRWVTECFRNATQSARVLAVFERAVDLVTDEGDVIALVTDQVGAGPLNVVVDGLPGSFLGLDAGMTAELEADRIAVGGRVVVSLDEATVWEPRPDWEALRARREIVTSRLPSLRAIALLYASSESLLVTLDRDAPVLPVAAVREGIAHLRAGWAGDMDALREGARRLAGLGVGLTPAGDDFLVGVMLRSWLEHPDPRAVCEVIAGEACPRTTTLSAAFLRAAARGECSAAWHALLEALEKGNDDLVEGFVREALSHGATSGADTLAGFLGGITREATHTSD